MLTFLRMGGKRQIFGDLKVYATKFKMKINWTRKAFETNQIKRIVFLWNKVGMIFKILEKNYVIIFFHRFANKDEFVCSDFLCF